MLAIRLLRCGSGSDASDFSSEFLLGGADVTVLALLVYEAVVRLRLLAPTEPCFEVKEDRCGVLRLQLFDQTGYGECVDLCFAAVQLVPKMSCEGIGGDSARSEHTGDVLVGDPAALQGLHQSSVGIRRKKRRMPPEVAFIAPLGCWL